MPTSTNVTNLKINELTEAQYDTAVQQGIIGENELSVITDMTDKAVQVSVLPTASAAEENNIYQFVGTTDANYTNGYFYKCVSDGQDPATYSWSQVSVQPAPSGLPDQTGQSGKFLTTDGTDASWSDKPLVNKATGTESLGILNNQSGNYNTVVGVKDTDFSSSVNGATTLGYKAVVSSSEGAVAIGRQAKVGANNTSDGGIAIGYLASTTYGGLSSTNAICIGKSSHATGSRSLAIGSQAVSGAAGAIQLGGTSTSSATTNSDANTFKVANANGNFEIMSADGTVPTDRFTTTPSADGTYVPTLTIASGVATRTWSAPASGTSSISVTLPAADWVNDEQTVTATGVTASNTVIVGAAPASASEYNTSGVICTAQGADSLTFSCSATPSNDLTVTVLIF